MKIHEALSRASDTEKKKQSERTGRERERGKMSPSRFPTIECGTHTKNGQENRHRTTTREQIKNLHGKDGDEKGAKEGKRSEIGVPVQDKKIKRVHSS